MGKKQYTTDNGGIATSCDDLKIFMKSSTWATKLSQIANIKGKIILMTYGFKEFSSKYYCSKIGSEDSYIKKILDKRPHDIFILCNSDNIEDAKLIKKLYPNIEIKHSKDIHASIALIEPQTVIFSSAEFGYSSFAEFGVGFHSANIYNDLLIVMRDYWIKASRI